MNYEIKITGSGTREELIEALKHLAESIKYAHADEIVRSYEDKTLFTEISESEG